MVDLFAKIVFVERNSQISTVAVLANIYGQFVKHILSKNLLSQNFYQLDFSTTSPMAYVASSILAVILFPISCISVLAVIWILYKNYRSNSLRKNRFQKRYGTLLEGLNLNTKIGVFWNAIVLIRWVLTDLLLIFFKDIPELQIFLLLLLSWVFLCLLFVGHPQSQPLDHFVSVFGESMISAYLYVMLTLTDYHSCEDSREGIG